MVDGNKLCLRIKNPNLVEDIKNEFINMMESEGIKIADSDITIYETAICVDAKYLDELSLAISEVMER